MGRAPCCDKTKVKKGPWSPQEDTILKNYVQKYGTSGSWIALPHKAGLNRCGKSCRLRWLNYLRPDIKHGGFTQEEDNIILKLYHSIGSRWAVIAAQLPGRTDNDLKNYWNTKLKKKLFANEKSTDSVSSASTIVTASNAATSNYFSLAPLISLEAEQINNTMGPLVQYNYPIEMNFHQEMVNIPLPTVLVEIPDIINEENNCVFPMCEEIIPSLSPSFSLDNNSTASCASSWSNNGYSGHEDDLFLAEFGSSYDLLNYDFDFQEKLSTDDPYPNYFLANIDFGQGFFGQISSLN